LYVTDYDGNQSIGAVTPIDLTTGRTVYVASVGDGTITPISPGTNRAGKTFFVGNMLSGIVMSPVQRRPPTPKVTKLRVYPHAVSIAGQVKHGRCAKLTSATLSYKHCTRQTSVSGEITQTVPGGVTTNTSSRARSAAQRLASAATSSPSRQPAALHRALASRSRPDATPDAATDQRRRAARRAWVSPQQSARVSESSSRKQPRRNARV
jgi:hypothetical protein